MSSSPGGLPRLYFEFAEWWPLVSAPGDYAAEVQHHLQLLERCARRPIATLLELGCGGGNSASHLKQRCRLMLVDLSPHMLEMSKRVNPSCEHLTGDMRSLRLQDREGRRRSFDAVLIHDAVMYLRTEAELLQTMRTAFDHCAPGGAALLVPDCVRETWAAGTGHGGNDGPDGRSIRFLDWTIDPDPTDTEFVVEIAYLLKRPDGSVSIEHDRHRFGLFPTETWLRLLAEAGFETSVHPCGYPGADSARSFVGVRAE